MREQRIRAHALRVHDERPRAVDRASSDLCAGFLFDRNRFASDHRFIDRRSAFEDSSVHRNTFAGPDTQPLADADFAQWHVSFRTVSLDPSSGLGREAQQISNRAACSTARTQLQHLTEQYEDHNDGCGLEVHGDLAHDPEGIREHSRGERCDDAVDVGGSRRPAR